MFVLLYCWKEGFVKVLVEGEEVTCKFDDSQNACKFNTPNNDGPHEGCYLLCCWALIRSLTVDLYWTWVFIVWKWVFKLVDEICRIYIWDSLGRVICSNLESIAKT